MKTHTVRDLMIPLELYPAVAQDATVHDALVAIREFASSFPGDRQPPRAVLVQDDLGEIVGQVGYLDMLRALEPRYRMLGDLDLLSRAGVTRDLLDALIDNLNLWHGELADVCDQARTARVVDVMHPIVESLDEEVSLSEAIHKIVLWQTMRTLVTREGKAVGLLRLADVIQEITNCLGVQTDEAGAKGGNP